MHAFGNILLLELIGTFNLCPNKAQGWKWHNFFPSDIGIVLTSKLGVPVRAHLQYIPRNMHTVCALLCFVVVIRWLIFPYPPGLLRWHCGNLTIAPVPAKQPWWIWINTSCEIFMIDYITKTKQSTTKPCAYLLGYTVCALSTLLTCNPVVCFG